MCRVAEQCALPRVRLLRLRLLRLRLLPAIAVTIGETRHVSWCRRRPSAVHSRVGAGRRLRGALICATLAPRRAPRCQATTVRTFSHGGAELRNKPPRCRRMQVRSPTSGRWSWAPREQPIQQQVSRHVDQEIDGQADHYPAHGCSSSVFPPPAAPGVARAASPAALNLRSSSSLCSGNG